MSCPTPHIAANPEDFAKTVLMPGDPLRSQMIAEKYLDDAKLINNVRGVQGYTGFYNGTRVSVMASGMGSPSMGIYSYELFHFFDVDNIIRVGSAGGMQPQLRLRDVVIAQGACCDSRYGHDFRLPGTFAPIAGYGLLTKATETATELGLRCHVGNVVTSDLFYHDEQELPEDQRSVAQWAKMGVLAVEMETAALYMNAARAGKNALAICTVSDHVVRGEYLPAAERQESFTEMITLALETVRKL